MQNFGVTKKDSHRSKMLQRYATRVMGGLAVFLAVIVMYGWHVNNTTLIQISPLFAPMQYNTALCFLLCGVGAVSVTYKYWRIALTAGSIVAFIAFLTLLEYITATDLAIDRAFGLHYVMTNTSHPGRMAPNTALCFLMLSSAILLSHKWDWIKHRIVMMELLGFLVFSFAVVALCGYLMNIEFTHGWKNITRMAAHTAVGFIILSVGMVAYSWSCHKEWMTKMPPCMPVMICLGGFLFDVSVPLSGAAGVIYVLLIYCTAWYVRPSSTFIFAVVGTLLIGLGYYVSYAHSDSSIVLVNRVLTAVMLWIVAYFVFVQKEFHMKLAESEGKLFSVMDNTVDGIITINSAGIVQTYNKACETMFGYKAAEVVGQNINMLMPEPYRHEHSSYLKHYEKTGEKRIIGIGREVEGRHKSGEAFPVDVSVGEVKIDGESVFTGILRDITQRKEAESSLLAIGQIIEKSLNEIYIFDAKSLHFIQVNKGARDNLGYSMDELKEMTPLDIKPDYTQAEFNRLVKPLLEHEKEKIVFQTVHQRKDGTLYDVEVHLQLFFYGTKQVFTAIILDTTERKKAEAERESLIQQLTSSNEELDGFSYIASHDLKEPLRGISNHASFLKKDHYDTLNDEAKHKIDRIIFLAERMEGLVSDLLYYSRLGYTKLAYKEVNLNELVHDVKDTILAAVPDGSVSIDILDTLPTIVCDRSKVSELFRNLIQNGIKYNQRERKYIEIGLEEADKKQEDAVFYVKDNGIGIDAKFYDDIFRIFKRLHKKEAYGGGTGSGLTFVKRIVQRHKGRIWLDSKEDVGTSFYFTLPSGGDEE